MDIAFQQYHPERSVSFECFSGLVGAEYHRVRRDLKDAKLLPENTVVFCLNDVQAERALNENPKIKVAIVKMGNVDLASIKTRHVLCIANETSETHDVLNIPKLFPDSGKYAISDGASPRERRGFFSHVNLYRSRLPESHAKFMDLKRICESFGIPFLINLGFQKDETGEFDYSNFVDSLPVFDGARATVHIKSTDYVANAVVLSLRRGCPVITDRDTYEAGYMDSLPRDGVVVFNDLPSMAKYMRWLQDDDQEMRDKSVEAVRSAREYGAWTNDMAVRSRAWLGRVIADEHQTSSTNG